MKLHLLRFLPLSYCLAAQQGFAKNHCHNAPRRIPCICISSCGTPSCRSNWPRWTCGTLGSRNSLYPLRTLRSYRAEVALIALDSLRSKIALVSFFSLGACRALFALISFIAFRPWCSRGAWISLRPGWSSWTLGARGS